MGSIFISISSLFHGLSAMGALVRVDGQCHHEGTQGVGHILDARGEHIGTVQEKVMTFLPKFELYAYGEYLGCLQREFTLFTPRYTFDLAQIFFSKFPEDYGMIGWASAQKTWKGRRTL